MTGQRVGYVRVSTVDQNPDRQLDSLRLARTFTDKASGRDVARPKLAELLRFVRDGDTVVVHSLDRLGRNLDDLRRLVGELTGRGVRVEFVQEQLAFSGEDSPMAHLLLSVMGAFAEFERALIRERQRVGIALARQRGAYRGRERSLTPAQVVELTRRAAAGEAKTALAKAFGISRETVYQYLRGARPCRPQVTDSVGPRAPRGATPGGGSNVSDRGYGGRAYSSSPGTLVRREGRRPGPRQAHRPATPADAAQGAPAPRPARAGGVEHRPDAHAHLRRVPGHCLRGVATGGRRRGRPGGGAGGVVTGPRHRRGQPSRVAGG
jgi:DNA invertase Pin-like site-specific DNA recombinase